MANNTIIQDSIVLGSTKSGADLYVVVKAVSGTAYKVYKSIDSGVTWAQVGTTLTLTLSNAPQPWGIAIDDVGNIFVVYSNSGPDLYYNFWNGSSWHGQTLIATLTRTGGSTYVQSWVDLKKSGTHLTALFSSSFSGFTVGTVQLYAFDYNGSTWDAGTELNDESLSKNPIQSSLTIDSANNAHVAFIGRDDDGTNAKLFYTKRTSGSWSTAEDVAGTTGWSNAAIAVDSTDNPHIFSQNGDLIHATKSGTWSTETVASSIIANELAIMCDDATGSARGAFYYSSTNKATTLSSDISPETQITSTLSSPINFDDTASLISTVNFPTSSTETYFIDALLQITLANDILAGTDTIDLVDASLWSNDGHGYISSDPQLTSTLTANASATAGTLYVDSTSGWPSSGSGIVGRPGNQSNFDYTGKTGTTFTGVTYPYGGTGHYVGQQVLGGGELTRTDSFTYTSKSGNTLTGVSGISIDHFSGEYIITGGQWDFDPFAYTGKSGNNLTGVMNESYSHATGTQVMIFRTIAISVPVVDATAFASSGSVTIGTGGSAETKSYTGKSGNTLTGLSGLVHGHSAGESVTQTGNFNTSRYDTSSNSSIGQIRFMWDYLNGGTSLYTLYERKKNGSFNTIQIIDTAKNELDHLSILEVGGTSPSTTTSYSYIQNC